jgi:hypothetical protein
VKKLPVASLKSWTLIEAILSKMQGLSKPRKKFISAMLVLFISLRGRHTFMNLSRYSSYSEKALRLQYEEPFDFACFNQQLISRSGRRESIIAFDPCYLPKSGKHTYGVDTFWSGCLGKAAKGLEIVGIGIVDIQAHTALHWQAVQTPTYQSLQEKKQSLLAHYAQVIIDRKEQLATFSSFLVADAYFSKQPFVDQILQETPFQLISKLRSDARLRYLYQGEQKQGRGRPKVYDGKLQVKQLQMHHFSCTTVDEKVALYQAIVYCDALKRKINLVVVENLSTDKSRKGQALLFSTDLSLAAQLIYQYYKARFQLEFLYRDAKQFTGLTHCQARSQHKIDFHVNLSLTAVSVAKAAHYLPVAVEQKGSFSLLDIQTLYFNDLLLERFIARFAIDTNLQENKQAYLDLLSFGRVAA